MKAKALIAALALLLAAGFTVRAEGTWSVEETSYNSTTKKTTFTISRTETTYEQKVLYRTVGLTAYNGQHFTETYGVLTFQAGTPSMTVQVQEKTPTAGAYLYQNGNTVRSYKMEVTDRAGFLLADCTRTMSNGSSFSDSYVNKSVTDLVYFQSGSVKSGSGNKYLDVAHSGTNGTEKMIDDGYDYNDNTLCTVSTDNLYGSNNSSLRTWLNSLSYKMYATVYFQQREVNDGYQYIQILTDNATTYDGKDGDGKIDNGPSISLYKAAFILTKTEDHLNSWKYQAFPHKTDDHTSSTEFDYSDSYLYVQAFKSSSYRATTSGSLVLNPTVNDINVRFDANGSGDDTWYLKNLKVRLALVDANAPTVLSNSETVAPGRHSKGNTVYVSVAFNEIVKVTGTPTLTTTTDNKWGSLSYVAGDGTNVLTFSTIIPADASGNLNITGLSGTVKDLAGNSFTGSVTASNLCSLDADLAYTLGDFKMEGGAYLITCHDDLNGLAGYVNAGNNCSGLTFRQVTNVLFPHTTNWNSSSSTENNYTAIGKSGSSNRFEGDYDGEGHTISGIRIYRGGNSSGVDNFQGLFGVVGSSGTVRNVNLSDSRITGFDNVGGIVGYSIGTVEDCTVTANVCLHIVQGSAGSIGGIVGGNRGNIYRCVSRACITQKSGISPTLGNFGGIAGYNYGSNTITDCIAEGVTIPNTNGRGVILGYDESGNVILTRNYYLGCTVAGVANSTGVGQGTQGSTNTSDPDGAQPLWVVTLPAHTSLVRTGTNLPITGYATYDNGADIAGVPYAKATSTLNLSYDSAAISQGHDVVITAAETSSGNPVAVIDNGNHTYTIASMPAADITVTATEVPVVSYIDADGTEQNCTNYTVIQSSNSDVTLSSSNSQPAWYVVPAGTVTVSGKLWFYDPDVRLIVCDGATLNVTRNYGNAIQSHGSLTIYGQSQQSGTLTATATSDNGNAICSTNRDINNITINGGTVNATANSYAIRANVGSITINRGNVTANSRDNDGIYAHRSSNNVGGDVTINGGTVSATSNGTGCGIAASGTISLGCATAADRITASSYAGNVVIADGQTLTDGTATYSGTLTNEEIAAIAGKTLQSAAGAVSYIDADGVQRVCVGATQITSSGFYGSNSNAESWYYVSGEVSLNSRLVFSDHNVHLILCDGANLMIDTSNSSYAALVFLDYASIYGQSSGSGSINITSKDNGIGISSSNGTFSINGGNISVDASEGSGISTMGDVIIRRGTVNVTGSYGIRGANISILGGNVTANGTNRDGIYSFSDSITLGWSNSEDSITASGYGFSSGSGCSLLVATGQALTDGTVTYIGVLSSEQIAAIAGKTLQPVANPSDDILGLTARKSKFGGIRKYFTTFYHPTKNYKLLDGAQAFTLNGSKQFYLVGNGSIVPANCAVIIFADKPAVSLTAIDINTPPSPVGTNILQGVGVATAASTLVSENKKVYVISGNNNGIGLYEYTGTTIPAYKAYIVE